MDSVKLSTKKTNLAYLIAGITESLLYAGIGIYCLYLKEDMLSSWKFDYAQTLNTVSILMFIFAFINFAYKLMASTTFADVYSNKIVGKGLQQLSVKDFDLDFRTVVDISCTGRFLNINTAAGKYRIITNAKCAKEIFDFYNATKQHTK